VSAAASANDGPHPRILPLHTPHLRPPKCAYESALRRTVNRIFQNPPREVSFGESHRGPRERTAGATGDPSSAWPANRVARIFRSRREILETNFTPHLIARTPVESMLAHSFFAASPLPLQGTSRPCTFTTAPGTRPTSTPGRRFRQHGPGRSPAGISIRDKTSAAANASAPCHFHQSGSRNAAPPRPSRSCPNRHLEPSWNEYVVSQPCAAQIAAGMPHEHGHSCRRTVTPPGGNKNLVDRQHTLHSTIDDPKPTSTGSRPCPPAGTP